MNLRALLPTFAQHLSARAAAPRTIASYTRTAAAFFDVGGDTACTRGDVDRFLARPGHRGRVRGASSKRAELIALRAFFRFAADAGVADPTVGLGIRRERRADPAVLMPNEVAPLFEAAKRTACPARDVTVVALLLAIGLRVHELAALEVEQVDLSVGVLRRVHGKGGTITDFPLPDAVVAILAAWLTERSLLGHERGALFPTARPSRATNARLSIRSFQRLVNRLADDAHLGRRLGPHALGTDARRRRSGSVSTCPPRRSA